MLYTHQYCLSKKQLALSVCFTSNSHTPRPLLWAEKVLGCMHGVLVALWGVCALRVPCSLASAGVSREWSCLGRPPRPGLCGPCV